MHIWSHTCEHKQNESILVSLACKVWVQTPATKKRKKKQNACRNPFWNSKPRDEQHKKRKKLINYKYHGWRTKMK